VKKTKLKYSVAECIRLGKQHAIRLKKCQKETRKLKKEIAKYFKLYCLAIDKLDDGKSGVRTEFAKKIGLPRSTLADCLLYARVMEVVPKGTNVNTTEARKAYHNTQNKADNAELKSKVKRTINRDEHTIRLEYCLEMIDTVEKRVKTTPIRMKDETILDLIARIGSRLSGYINDKLEDASEKEK
jgi:hypothetical protein